MRFFFLVIKRDSLYVNITLQLRRKACKIISSQFEHTYTKKKKKKKTCTQKIHKINLMIDLYKNLLCLIYTFQLIQIIGKFRVNINGIISKLS
jgi:hypothetical protein